MRGACSWVTVQLQPAGHAPPLSSFHIGPSYFYVPSTCAGPPICGPCTSSLLPPQALLPLRALLLLQALLPAGHAPPPATATLLLGGAAGAAVELGSTGT